MTPGMCKAVSNFWIIGIDSSFAQVGCQPMAMWWATAGNVAVLWGHWLGQQYDRKRWSTLSCQGAGTHKMAAPRVASLDLVMSSGTWRWASAPSSGMVLARSEVADSDWMLEAASGGLTVGCAFTLATLDLAAVWARVPGAWVGIDSNDRMLLVATTLGFPVADPCLCLGSAFGIALVLLAVGPCFCLGPTMDTAFTLDFGLDPRPAGVVVVSPGDGTFMMDVHCGSGTKDNKPDSMCHCSKTSTHVGGW